MSFLGQAAVIVEDDIDIFLDKFAEQSEGWEDAELQKEQFRSLFTAWCLLNNVDADTQQCDEWKELLKSEEECADGLMELECKEQIGKSIWQLPCGWYVQYV